MNILNSITQLLTIPSDKPEPSRNIDARQLFPVKPDMGRKNFRLRSYTDQAYGKSYSRSLYGQYK